jgi:hypothetical protein
MIKHLTAVLGLDKTGFDAGMAAAGKQVNQFGAGLKSSLAGAFGASAFIALAKSAIEAADQIEEISERLGVTTIQAQQFALAAKMGGSDVEFFAVKLEKLRKSLTEGIAKGENPLDVFGAEATTDAVKAMEIFANAFSNGGMTGEQETRYFDLIEKGAGKLKIILGGLNDARGGALFFSEEDVQRGKQVSDYIDKAGVSLKTLFMMSIDPKKGPLTQLLGAMGINAFGVLDAPKVKPKTGVDEAARLSKLEAERIAQLEREEWAQRMFRIESQTEDIAEKNRIAGLSTEERLVELAAEREKIFQRIAATEEERAQKQLDLANNEADIIGLSKDPAKKADGAFRINETAMGRIGAFTGAAASAALPPGQAQQLQQLQKIYDAMVIKGIVVRDSR